MQTSTRAMRARKASADNAERQQRQRLLSELGPSIRAGAVANRLGVPVPMVEHLRVSNRLLAVPDHHGYLYPVWQFEGRGVLSGLMSVLLALADSDPWARLVFLLTPNGHLAGQRPLDTLGNGEIEAVLDAARWHTQGG
jgi:hypothetical protein